MARKSLAAWAVESWTRPGKRMRASQFERLEIAPGDVVFLGDSITEGGLWNEWFPGVQVKNRGISGDLSAGVRARLATAATNDPAAVFLLIGTNDLSQGADDHEIVENIRQIIRSTLSAAPSTTLFLQSIMPRKPKLTSRIRTLNAQLAEVASATGATWIDLWPALADANGAIRSEYSLDALHLNGAGYVAWVEVLHPHVKSIVGGKLLER